jgi:5-formyltetrahydrofolate cyclo-ligase
VTEKKRIRAEMLSLRLQLPPAVRQDAALKAKDVFLKAVPLRGHEIIAGYTPMKGEIDVLPLLRHLQEKGHRCVLPLVTGPDEPLSFHAWGDKSSLLTPDIILTPLLAFDRHGHRLGYGGGHYDRTFARLEGAQKVGFAYDMQRRKKLPALEHDVKLDMVVTEKKVYKTAS